MNANLMLGVPTIDRQHIELFRSFEHLVSAGVSEEVLSDVLSRLTLQICNHFQTEEGFMAGLDLPSKMLKAHHQAHEQIIEDLTQIHLDSMRGQGLPFEETVATVASCVNAHLVEFDLELRPYLQQKA